MRCVKYISLLILSILVLLCICVPALHADQTQQEEEMGRDYAKQVEQQCKIVTDKAVVDRVQRVGETLAKIANELEVPAHYGSSNICKFKYEFKVVEDKDVNAFSLPGGKIYVNTGLLDLVQSDDELAGVLAHEIAHSAHHHMLQLAKKQSSVDRYIALITLAGILSNMRSNDLNNLLYGAQLMRTGKISGYTYEAEKDADKTAVAYLAKSPYNAEGLLSFMKKLDAKHDANPTLPLGIFETHPAPFRRVASIAKAMKAEGIVVDMRKEQDVAYAKSVPVKDGSDQYEVTIGKKVIYEPANLSGKTSKERAEAIAKTINKMLDSGVTGRDVLTDPSSMSLIAKGQEIIKIEQADSALMGNDNRALLKQARSAIEYAVWADWLCDKCQVVQEANDEGSD